MHRRPVSAVLDLLVCPLDHLPLSVGDGECRCEGGHTFPIYDGIPVLLPRQVEHTHATAVATTEFLVKQGRSSNQPPRANRPADEIDAYVQKHAVDVAGRLYSRRVGSLDRYPIPRLRLSQGDGDLFLDIGCNWGRWCVSALRKGYFPVGIDPSLEAILAARRVATQLDMEACFLVADARWLPFPDGTFPVVFSYSVIQHFSRPHASAAVAEIARVLAEGGECLIQMPNAIGLVSLYHQFRRGFRKAREFEVRYWTPASLRQAFEEVFDDVTLEVDGYFGLGVGAANPDDLPVGGRIVVDASRLLARQCARVPPLKYLADSLYVRAKNSSQRAN